MAKVTCEFDTVSKEMSVAVDGKKMKNVMCFSCYQDMMCIDMASEDEDSGMRHYERITASESDEAKSCEDSVASDIENYVKIPTKSQLSEDIGKYLNKKRR